MDRRQGHEEVGDSGKQGIAMDLAQCVRRLVLREERKPNLQLPFLGEEGTASRERALLAGGGFITLGKLGHKEV